MPVWGQQQMQTHYNDLVSPELGMKLDGSSTPYVCRTFSELRWAISSYLRGSIAGLYSDTTPMDPRLVPEYNSATVTNEHRCAIVVYIGPGRVKTKKYAGFILVRGDPKGLEDIITKLCETYKTSLVPDVPAVWEARRFFTLYPYTIKHIAEIEQKVYVVGSTQWTHFFNNINIDAKTKVLSGYYNMIPSVRQWIEQNTKVLAYKEEMGLGNLDQAAIILREMIIKAALLLSPAFSRADKIKEQLAHRIQAASAAGSFQVPTLEAITHALVCAAWTSIPGHPLIAGVIGRAIALTPEGVYDPDVYTTNMMTLDQYQLKYEVPNWTIRLVEQARLIFQYYQATSINFAVQAWTVCKDIVASLGGVWLAEATSVGNFKELLAQAPYCGCREAIPEARQVAKVARMAYIGLEYWRTNQTGQTELDDFNKFAIGGVVKHITPRSDLETCKAIVSVLPRNPVLADVTILHHLTMDKAITVMVDRPADHAPLFPETPLASGGKSDKPNRPVLDPGSSDDEEITDLTSCGLMEQLTNLPAREEGLLMSVPTPSRTYSPSIASTSKSDIVDWQTPKRPGPPTKKMKGEPVF